MRLRVSMRVRSEEGTSLLEFAMALPVVGLLLVSIIWSGITFYDYVLLADAVSASARQLATSRNYTTTTDNACQMAETILTTGTQNLNQSNLTSFTETSTTEPAANILPPQFAGNPYGYTSTCGNLLQDDTAVVGAAYACNLAIPFTGMNLCPMAQGQPIEVEATVTKANGTTTQVLIDLGNCPFAHCISSTTTVRIE